MVSRRGFCPLLILRLLARPFPAGRRERRYPSGSPQSENEQPASDSSPLLLLQPLPVLLHPLLLNASGRAIRRRRGCWDEAMSVMMMLLVDKVVCCCWWQLDCGGGQQDDGVVVVSDAVDVSLNRSTTCSNWPYMSHIWRVKLSPWHDSSTCWIISRIKINLSTQVKKRKTLSFFLFFV